MTTLIGDTVLAPATVVDALPVAPPLVSLLSSALVNDEGDDRGWAAGIAHEQDEKGLPAGVDGYWWLCAEGSGVEATDTGAGPNNGVKYDGTGVGPRRWRPFDVVAAYSCTGNQPIPAGEREARARRLLASVLSAAIERELWTGAVAQAAGFPNDYLELNPTQVGGAAIGPRRALAELEQAVADVQAGVPAMIHAQPRVVTAWASAGLVTPSASGRQLRTALGTLVVPGAGYPGSGEGLEAGAVGSSWAYVTGLVRVWLGPVQVIGLGPAEYDTSVNDFIVRAERATVYSFDEDLHHGALVDLTVTDY